MRLTRQSGSEKSFTLIELIMTIVVVGLISFPLAVSLSSQVQGTVKSAEYTTALNLARFEIERVNNLAYASVLDASFSNYQGYAYDLDRAVSYAQGGAASAESLKQVTVSVRKSGGAAVLLSLTTYIARNVSYGL